jgi:hypothetical protein
MRAATALIAIVLAASACAATPRPTADATPYPVTNYVIGVVQRASLGAPILHLQSAGRVPTYMVANDYAMPHLPLMGIPTQLRRGTVFRAFRSATNGDLILVSEEFSPEIGILIDPTGAVTGGFADSAGRITVRGEWPAEPIFTVVEELAEQIGALRVQIIYSGVNGGTLKAFYQEYMNGQDYSAFAQELRFDLDSSRTISYRGIRIEVLRADAAEIEYRVLEDGGLPWLPR